MKQLILLLDGTWNDADTGERDTNIVRLRGILDRSLDKRPARHRNHSVGQAEALEPMLASRAYQGDGVEHLVFYERGIGTGPGFDAVAGAAFGDGLNDNIRRAYKFLSTHYELGDEIFIFGFSRGAFTARSLAGYVSSAGLLMSDACTPAREAQAWGFYRTDPGDRLPADRSALTPFVWDRAKLTIEVLGVFDTVGSLGIPLKAFKMANRAKYGFHDVELNSAVRFNLQALAIDEHRAPFEATVWRQTLFSEFSGRVEQVWFAGCHGDIGGAQIIEATRAMLSPHALDDIALDWMLKRVNALCPRFPVDRQLAWKVVDTAWSLSQSHEARQGAWKVLPFCERAIANVPIAQTGWQYVRVNNYDRHAKPLGEMVHVSAIERLGSDIVIDDEGEAYQPQNLLQIFEIICATYQVLPGQTKPAYPILIVDWNGLDLDPFDASERARAVDLLLAVRARLRL